MTPPDHLTSEMRVRVGTPHPLGAGKSCSEPQNPRRFLLKKRSLGSPARILAAKKGL